MLQGDPHLGLTTFGSNVFPDEEIPRMRPILTEYHTRIKDLGNKIMRLLSLSLDLEEDYLETHVTRKEPVARSAAHVSIFAAVRRK